MKARKPPSNDWRKCGRLGWTPQAMLKRDIRAATTRSKKKGIKVSLPNVRGTAP
jgi:hypothetical protein